jgi:uncharacterized protein (TIGR00255 family)
MSMQSMTGFGRSSGQTGPWEWRWEVRSVNGRGLDVRLRLPTGFEALDQPARQSIGKSFQRGNLNITLSLSQASGAQGVRLNETVLEEVIAAAEAVRAKTGGAPPTVEGLLSLRGVLESVDGTEQNGADVDAEVVKALLSGLDAAIGEALSVRRAEGQRLTAIVSEKLDDIQGLTVQVRDAPGRSVEAIQSRLKAQVEKLLNDTRELDVGRLHQEAALLATRADVEEELKRLETHLSAARALLTETGAVGRRLDFLCQEFNREANTLCSKAADEHISSLGVALKVAIDQMREQVQNLE